MTTHQAETAALKRFVAQVALLAVARERYHAAVEAMDSAAWQKAMNEESAAFSAAASAAIEAGIPVSLVYDLPRNICPGCGGDADQCEAGTCDLAADTDAAHLAACHEVIR